MGHENVRHLVRGGVLALGLFLVGAVEVVGQAMDLEGAIPPRTTPPLPTMPAVRVQNAPPVIDGRLDDVTWRNASVVTGFVQFDPNEGVPATHDTEVRVLYDDDAIYVAFRAFDPSPESIVALRTRRDQGSASDRVHVVIDSYFDRRTAFHFAVNAAGVKMDLYRFDDTNEYIGWDAVWDVATQIDDLGWTAEFRIPLSQLRFSGAPRQDWGINFARDIARYNEASTWAPLSRNDQALVSRSGILQGLENLAPASRLEVLPYSVMRGKRTPGDPTNPFYRPTTAAMTVGADLKYGVTQNLTLDLTVNPDFGQVEADPSQVNLTAFETFNPEQRPFFQEGAGIFRFGLGWGGGDTSQQSLFYSRRIGRSPQGSYSGAADWVDAPRQTRILGAAKLSGKSEGGWSVGLLSSLTRQEEARVMTAGLASGLTVEPMTSYSVLRVQRDFREGASAIGVIGTATARDAEAADALRLRKNAFTGGVDFRHRFYGNRLELRGSFIGSQVSGSPEAIDRTQRSSARYFQRPDAKHLTLDPDARSMQGYASSVELWKIAGGNWRYALATLVRSPGFEVNDLGFLPQVDAIEQVAFAGYQNSRPGTRLRRWGVNLSGSSSWDFGGENQGLAGNLNTQLTTLGNRNVSAGITGATRGLNARALRGGPSLRSDPRVSGWLGGSTDSRKDVQFGTSHGASYRWAGNGSWESSASPWVRWRPNEWATVRVGPSYARRVEDTQWVGRLAGGTEPVYVLGRMDQETLGIDIRADLALASTLTLQFYAQPFMSTGAFSDFKRVGDPRAMSHGARFIPIAVDRVGSAYQTDLTGDGSQRQFGSPDFNIRQFRSNAVLRWEFRPGSTAYLVWAQSRDFFSQESGQGFGDGFGSIFGSAPENIFMLKVSYWMNP